MKEQVNKNFKNIELVQRIMQCAEQAGAANGKKAVLYGLDDDSIDIFVNYVLSGLLGCSQDSQTVSKKIGSLNGELTKLDIYDNFENIVPVEEPCTIFHIFHSYILLEIELELEKSKNDCIWKNRVNILSKIRSIFTEFFNMGNNYSIIWKGFIEDKKFINPEKEKKRFPEPENFDTLFDKIYNYYKKTEKKKEIAEEETYSQDEIIDIDSQKDIYKNFTPLFCGYLFALAYILNFVAPILVFIASIIATIIARKTQKQKGRAYAILSSSFIFTYPIIANNFKNFVVLFVYLMLPALIIIGAFYIKNISDDFSKKFKKIVVIMSALVSMVCIVFSNDQNFSFITDKLNTFNSIVALNDNHSKQIKNITTGTSSVNSSQEKTVESQSNPNHSMTIKTAVATPKEPGIIDSSRTAVALNDNHSKPIKNITTGTSSVNSSQEKTVESHSNPNPSMTIKTAVATPKELGIIDSSRTAVALNDNHSKPIKNITTGTSSVNSSQEKTVESHSNPNPSMTIKTAIATPKELGIITAGATPKELGIITAGATPKELGIITAGATPEGSGIITAVATSATEIVAEADIEKVTSQALEDNKISFPPENPKQISSCSEKTQRTLNAGVAYLVFYDKLLSARATGNTREVEKIEERMKSERSLILQDPALWYIITHDASAIVSILHQKKENVDFNALTNMMLDEYAKRNTVSNYRKGIEVKAWDKWISAQNWSSDLFSQKDQVYKMYAPNLNNLFHPTSLDEDRKSTKTLNGRQTSCWSGFIRIEKAGEYKFIVSHPSVPASWSCGGYAVYINGIEMIKVVNHGYNPKDNEERSFYVSLQPGHHAFTLINDINWRSPAASHIQIRMNISGQTATHILSINDFGVYTGDVPSLKLQSCYSGEELFKMAIDEVFLNDNPQAIEMLEIAAQKGIVNAMGILGYYYRNGKYVEKNLDRAFSWFLQAAEKGSAEGQRDVADCYAYGTGVAQDWEKAFLWYEKSASQGFEDSMFKLAQCYELGQGIKQDLAKAAELYEQLSDNSFEGARAAYERVFNKIITIYKKSL